MRSLLILKQLRNLSDNSIVKQWSENAYYQYFGEEQVFRAERPCVATEQMEFRKRIGSEDIVVQKSGLFLEPQITIP